MEFGDNHDDMHNMHNMHSMHHDHDDSMTATTSSVNDSAFLMCQNSDEAMVMYMDGFRWTLTRSDNSCLNFFFGSWTLNTLPRFIGAMVCVVAMGIATEGIRKWMQTVLEQANRGDIGSSKRFLVWKHVCLQGLSILSAYLLMLVVMTYSIELLLCVVLGLMIGYYVFDGDSLRYGGGTPCCNFLEGSTETTTTTTTTTTIDPLTEALLPTTTNNNNSSGTTDNTDVIPGHSCCYEEGGA